MNAPPIAGRAYDVVIVGGALSGAATAILLRREQPKLRVLIVEKSTAFTRRVGEATVEVSAWFLTRLLGLTQYLNEAHLVKQGMRFWFANQAARTLDQCSEIGGRYLARVPAFQVDRATLDEEVLARAVAVGTELWRPAVAQRIELIAGGPQTLVVRRGEETETISARWVVDASGVAAILSRQQGWWRANSAHPTTAVWSRWRGVRDWDGRELAEKFPRWAAACHGVRGTATNHLVGDGWWAWCIPLKGGDVSVGVVFDQRLVEWPENGPLGQRLKDFLCQHPAGNEILKDAQWLEGDVHWRRNLPYFSDTYAGDGFALVGDAGAFIDPLYSPGMDWISYTAVASSELIFAQQRGEALAPLLARHNRDFTRSYARWFGAVYQDKYEYLGEYDLMRVAFLLDLGLYYLGVASQPFKWGLKAFREPVFSSPLSLPFFRFMRTYNRRFAAMARARRRRGAWGRRNAGRRFLIGGFTFAFGSMLPLLKAMLGWGWLELAEGWRSWFLGGARIKGAIKPMAQPSPAQS